MFNSFTIDEKRKVTVTIQPGQKAGYFVVRNKTKNEIEYFRYLTPFQKVISFNITRPGSYGVNRTLSDIKFSPIIPVDIQIELPEPEKPIRAKSFKIVYNPKLTGTPARNFYNKGVIEYSPEFKKLPYQIKLFILCHEIGHFYYHDEFLADSFGAKLYLKNGGNLTSAYYSLKYVLNNHSQTNQTRIKELFKILSNGKK